MDKKQFLNLLDKYLASNASVEEEKVLFKIYKMYEDDAENELHQLVDFDLIEHRLIERFVQSIALPAAPQQGLAFYKTTLFKIAASFLIIFLSAIAIYSIKQHSANDFSRLLTNKNITDLVSYTNNTDLTKKINFPDGSYVELASGSKIGFSKDFKGTKREVYLVGEGFFQVAKNHAKPFIVYTSHLVAKVLGTSFIVKSGVGDSKASVLVKTGKVSVFKSNEFTEEMAKPDLTDGVVLTPNHQVALNNKQVLEKHIADHPDMLKKINPADFNFDNTPVNNVFELLQNAYGITIIYDKEKFKACSISVKMGTEVFNEKLNLICETLNASYQNRDGNIYIIGAGCNN